MWHDGNGQLVRDIKTYLKEKLKTGKWTKVVIGCDSNATAYKGKHTFVTAIVLDTEGLGCCFIYNKSKIDQNDIRTLNERLLKEVQMSIEIAQELVDTISEFGCTISIHADINPNEAEASSSIIKNVVGWVEGMGFECHTKPTENSWAASSVADRFTS